MKKEIKVALYLRVSTTDKGQDTDNQLLELKQYCNSNSYEIYNTYIDHESGSKGRSVRKQFNQMFKDAAQHHFDLVAFWSLDRFSREGIKKTLHYLQLLDSYDVKFHSYTEEYLQTDNELIAHILIGVMSYFGEYEAQRISRQVKAGLERAKAEGKQLGRPEHSDRKIQRIKKLKKEGMANKAIALELKVSLNTVKKYMV